MEGPDPQARGVLSQEVSDAPAHFLGGAIGEGNRKYTVRRNAGIHYHMPDTGGQYASLPGSGTGEDEKRTAAMLHRLPLRLVQRNHFEWGDSAGSEASKVAPTGDDLSSRVPP